MPVVAVLFATLLTSTATRYGYHRDELYFLAAGRHLDWAYSDQPLITPLLARAMSAIDADSLLLLRVPAILAATLVVVCAGLMARELGGGRGAQTLAAAAVASAALLMGAGHTLSTVVFDLATWAVICLLMLKLLRGNPVPASEGAPPAPNSGGGTEREGADRVARVRREGDESGGEGSAGRVVAGRWRRRVGRVERTGGESGRGDGAGRGDAGRWGRLVGSRLSDGGDRSVPGAARWWLVIGVVVGIGLENKFLLIFPAAALLVSLLLVGPRKVFATKYFPASIGIAVALWLPWLWWQARNGWPQLELSRAIAGGSSGTSNSPIMFVLLQFGLMGPLLVPLWVFGWWRLWRESRYRAVALSYVVLFVLFAVTSGKAYYLGNMYPILLAAGSVPVAAWAGRRRIRSAAVGSVVTVNAVLGALLFLPVLPVATLKDSPVLAVNYDAGETVGWPEFAREIGEVRAKLGADVAILTANYGEAGAIERYGAPYNLPTPHSGHNSYWWWGPPSDTASVVIAVGIPRERLAHLFADIEAAGRIDNGRALDNDEQGRPIFLCRAPRAPWSELWAQVKHLS
ncbi:hypothetical protein [Nocardia sp. NPDC052566]|uniref:hypothetical protein n=1 Tax=Nocardia sp. NPDC052566 TaxID=3364330 RepID=UPI0037C87F15